MTGFMVNVVLPTRDEAETAALQSALDKEYNMYFVYGSVKRSSTGELLHFTRLSAQIYLQLSDFELLAQRVTETLARLRADK